MNRSLYKSVYAPSHIVKLGVRNRRSCRGLYTWDSTAGIPNTRGLFIYKNENCTPEAVKKFEPVYDWLRTGGSKVSIDEEDTFPVLCHGLFYDFLPSVIFKFETVVPYEVARVLQLTSHVRCFEDRLEVRLYWTIPCSTLKLNPASHPRFSESSLEEDYVVRQNDGAKRIAILSEYFCFDEKAKNVMFIRCEKRHLFFCSEPFNLNERRDFTGGPIMSDSSMIDIGEVSAFLNVEEGYGLLLMMDEFKEDSDELSDTFRHSMVTPIMSLSEFAGFVDKSAFFDGSSSEKDGDYFISCIEGFFELAWYSSSEEEK